MCLPVWLWTEFLNGNLETQTQDEVKKLYRYVTDTKFTAQLKDMGGLRHAADKWNLFHNGTVTTVTTLYF